MSLRNHIAVLLTAGSLAGLTVAGCVSEVDPEAAPSAFALTLSTNDAAQVLELVNYPGADLATLDDEVGLDVRAAQNIDEHRAGADAVFPSADDDLFDDIAELDSVPYVGDAAFEKLVAYAAANPAPSSESVEGVLFRGWESEIVVWAVNGSSLEELDALLDARAAQNLINGRPFATVTEMGPLAYVGVSALERLRSEAPAWWASREGTTSLAGTFDGVAFDEATAVVALEIANEATRDEMVDHGVYAAGAAAIVGNRPYTSLAEVAEVSGVGTSTMQGLHDYAASGEWDPDAPPPVEPPPVDPPAPPTNECVFGLVYRDIFTNGGTIVVAQRVVDPGSSTNATQRAQIVAAAQSAYEAVTTVSQAFAAVDENQMNHLEIWDASNRRPYTAYEFGAGDNSYGLVFEYGTTTVAARIIDGDLYSCTALWGDEMRPCERTVDCADGLTCFGTSLDVSTGRCMDLAAEEHAAEGSDCTLESGCPPASGLVCGGATRGGAGLCVPAWMRGRFESSAVPDLAIPDGSSVVVELPVYGLATVDTDVVIDLVIDHPRISDLRVTLTNPATAEVLVYDGAGQTGPEVALRNHVVLGFSGDEQVNGLWQLRVEDRTAGAVGSVFRFGLTVTSRWD